MTTGPSSSLLTAVCLFLDSRACFNPQQPSYSLQIEYCWKSGICGLFQTEKKGEFKYCFRRHGFALDSFIQKEDVFAGSERKGKLLKAVWI